MTSGRAAWVAELLCPLREASEQPELALQIREAMEEELTARQCRVLELLYARNMSLTGCARELGICVSSAARLRDRGMARLRRVFRYVRRNAPPKP